MTFVQIERRNGMINLDGYSRNKTLKGALSDLAREVAKIDEGEARAITDNIDEYIGMVVDGMLNEANCFYIEAEEVHCASRYSEKKDEIEYAEGCWYLYIRFVDTTAEPESEATETSATEQVVEVEKAVDAEHTIAEMLKTLDTGTILCMWELTENYEWTLDTAIYRSCLMNELQCRNRQGFGAWLEQEVPEDRDLRRFILAA